MADKTISELVAASVVTASDLFVLEQSGTAKKLTGQILENWLVSFADGHGGIQSITYNPPTPPSLIGTISITLADETVYSLSLQNGKGISSIAKTGTAGLVDTYTITYNDATTSTFTVTNGAKGDTGQNWYVHIKYSAVQPTRDSDMGDTPDNWIGIYSGTASSAPVHYTSYQWFEIKGAKGDTGDTGETGNGIASFELISGTHAPGTTDIYQITMTDGTSDTISVYNGSDGEGAPGSSLPLGLGVADAGSATAYSREDHIHPMPTPADLGAVPTTRTVNSKPLSSNVTLTASDVGAATTANITSAVAAITEIKVSNPTVGTAWDSNTHASDTNGAYPHRLAVPVTGVTSSMCAEVAFGVADATSGKYAPICECGAGVVYIWASEQTAPTILSILVHR